MDESFKLYRKELLAAYEDMAEAVNDALEAVEDENLGPTELSHRLASATRTTTAAWKRIGALMQARSEIDRQKLAEIMKRDRDRGLKH